MKLEQIYKDIIEEAKLIPEIGEGSSKPFPYKETFRGGRGFSFEINGEVRNENGEFVLQEIPIRLQGAGFPIEVGYDDDFKQWDIDGNIDDVAQEKGKFFNVNPGTTLKAIEITFSQVRGNSFSEVNDRVFMFRLMATIKKILQDEFAKEEPDLIIYSPTKQGDEAVEKTGRHRLYSAFIKKAFPSARMFVDDQSEEIIYKLK